VAPLSQFAQPQERQIAGMSPLQQYAGSIIPQISQGNPQAGGAYNLLGYSQAQPPYLNPQNANNGLDYGNVQQPMNAGQGTALPMGMTNVGEPGGGYTYSGPAGSSPPASSSGVQPGMSYGNDTQIGQAGNPNSALGLLQQMTSGPVGSSPATQAGMAAFQQNVLPTLQNELGAMGLGRSGIAGEQIQKATTSAAVPLIQQEIANREQGIGQYGNIAQQVAGLGQQDLTNKGTAAGMATSLGGTQQQIAQAALDAPYQDWLRRQSLSQSVTGLGGVPYQAPMQQTSTTPSPGFFGK